MTNYDSDFEMEGYSGDHDMSLDSYQEEQQEQQEQQELTSNIFESEVASSSAGTNILGSETASSSASKNTKKRSWVWAHFTYDENIKKACCNICKALIVTSKGSTTGMSKHLKNKHPLTIQKKKNQLTLQETIQNIPIPVSYI